MSKKIAVDIFQACRFSKCSFSLVVEEDGNARPFRLELGFMFADKKRENGKLDGSNHFSSNYNVNLNFRPTQHFEIVREGPCLASNFNKTEYTFSPMVPATLRNPKKDKESSREPHLLRPIEPKGTLRNPKEL